MPKHFRYRSLDDLQKDIDKLGLNNEIPLETDLSPLWNPVQFGSRTIGNSIAVNPMEGCDGQLDGSPDELVFRRWRLFGEGGAKLIWGEATAVLEEARANTRQLWLNDQNVGSFEKLLEGTRSAHKKVYGSNDDLVVGLQLTHSGRYSYKKPLIVFHDPAVDPVTWVDKKRKIPITNDYPILSDSDLSRVEDAIVNTALLAWKVGFDFVDIKQCHRYLLSELLAAKLRKGPYGGSLENRTRLVRNVIGRIREETNDQLLLASRMNVYDGIPYITDVDSGQGIPRLPYPEPCLAGFGVDANDPLNENLAEPVAISGLLRDAGVQMINVTMGSPYYNPHLGRPAERSPVDGYEAPEHPLFGVARHFRATTAIKNACPGLNIVGTGYSWLQKYMVNAGAANIRDQRVTIMGSGRGALAYPDFAKDISEHGEMLSKKSCITVSYCTALMRGKHNALGQFPVGCVPRDKTYADIYKEMIHTTSKPPPPKN
tara:strand:+ start:21024 stop:22478 length:1455 start_codon:yes stop_codon:yes gene_type:complete